MAQIEYRKGDLIEALINREVHILVHQTNCQGIWGGGIAKQLADKFVGLADNHKDLSSLFGGGKSKFVDLINLKQDSVCNRLGSTQHYWLDYTDLISDQKGVNSQFGLVVNLYAQMNISNKSRQTNYAALHKALQGFVDQIYSNLKGHIQRSKLVIGFPKIGCGLAGGDWEIVEEIINFTFKNFEGRIIVYEL